MYWYFWACSTFEVFFTNDVLTSEANTVVKWFLIRE